jgi:hypothetical protein
VNFNDLNWEEPLEGVKCKIFKHGDKQLRFVVYSKENAADVEIGFECIRSLIISSTYSMAA